MPIAQPNAQSKQVIVLGFKRTMVEISETNPALYAYVRDMLEVDRVKVLKRLTMTDNTVERNEQILTLSRELWHLNGVLEHDLDYD